LVLSRFYCPVLLTFFSSGFFFTITGYFSSYLNSFFYSSSLLHLHHSSCTCGSPIVVIIWAFHPGARSSTSQVCHVCSRTLYRSVILRVFTSFLSFSSPFLLSTPLISILLLYSVLSYLIVLYNDSRYSYLYIYGIFNDFIRTFSGGTLYAPV